MRMFKFIKNKFLFIVLISVATLLLLVVGAISLYKDPSLIFESDGYIIETTTKTSNQYYFTANTKYKENVDDKITFSDQESNKVTVDPASFVHYSNGSIAFLQRGAIVDLSEIHSPMISYYNITSQNLITYDNGQYVVSSNGRKIAMESFIGRINDSKYIIAGKNLSLKVPTEEERISGDYFEISFIEGGIVKIDNSEKSYQVTAQESYIYVGDNITISLGDGKIFYDGEAKMLLSQITINGDENIDLDIEKETSTGGGGTGSGGTGGSGDGSVTGEDGTGDGETGTGLENGTGTGTGTGTGNGTSDGGNDTTDSLQIELIEAEVSSTTLNLSLQLNNASLATGPVTAYLTNVSTGDKQTKSIELVNGTFQLNYESLVPATEYTLSIVENSIGSEKQYFQKTFKTKDLGLTLEKVYATDDSLSYKIIFDENTDVTKVHISIYDNNGTNTNISPSDFTVSKDDINNVVTFTGLKSNTSHSVSIDAVWINNAAYYNTYNINRIDTTLKKTPEISGVDVDANAEEVKFTIKLNDVDDPDSSIVSYIYNIYLADDVSLDNANPQIQYSVVKSDTDALVLNLNEIDELKTGVDYRCKIVAQYYDNEMIREVSTDYSGNFLIKSKPNITWELVSATMNKVEGVISLIDANCTVPINGRSCSNERNNFTLRFYKLKDSETTENDRIINFDSKTLTSSVTFSDLSSNTTYAVKVFGNYYDDDNVLHTNVQIGDTFYITTDKSDKLSLEIVGDNISGQNKDGTENSANVVTFDARLVAPQDSEVMEEISSLTLNLYSGRYNTADKLIGTYKMTDKGEIEDFFSNITIKNSMFTDVTSKKVGLIDSLEKLILVSNNSSGTLTGSYTVEVINVYDSTGKNEIAVENNVYTFNLTSSYYLDSRIATNPNENYVTATLIKKENLTESEYQKLAKDVNNLDDLNDDTVVGLILENSLTDIFVDSAFTYEKVVVDYIIYNETTKNEIKRISVDMGNKYQPKAQTIYLDSSELDDGKNYFTRGYKYTVGYVLNFTTEDGSNPLYDNDKLHKLVSIERQSPLYTQYISTSDSFGITYRFSFKDIDSALADKNCYYTLGEDETYQSVSNAILADGGYHDVTIPIEENTNYTLYYAKKNTSNKTDYVSITNYDFETEYQYNNENAFTIIENHENVLMLRLENQDVTNRAFVYKVEITDEDGAGLEYIRYFLASKLSTMEGANQVLDEDGNLIQEECKYIAIDYANISKFIGYKMKISITSYYDSGLVGMDQTFTNGFVIKNSSTNKFLNIYNGGSSTTSTSKAEADNMGLYLLKESRNKDDETIYIYNHLMNTSSYNSLIGATYYDTSNLATNIGIKFNVSYTNAGILLNTGSTDYSGYNFRVLKEAKLKSATDVYQFNTITPTVKVTTNNNTINSIKVLMSPQGIYGNKQFIKDGVSHNKVYVEFYSDEDVTNLLTTLTSNINLFGNDESGYSATIDELEYKDLIPATTYYFKVFAYIDDEYTQLFDSSSTTSYIKKTYSSSTLDAKGILNTNNSIKFSVTPVRYNGESSDKELLWRLGFKSTANYKVRMELYEQTGTTEVDGEVVTTYQLVNFDGSEATSCDINTTGTSSNGYLSNCYISVSKDDIASINAKNQTITFNGDNFVFGGSYYKLVVYAIPYTSGAYDEEHKLVLYQNDSLSTTGIKTANGITYDITIPTLEEASFSLADLTTGHTDVDGYYISFVPVITDTFYVIKYGTYTIKLKDVNTNEVATMTDVIVSPNNTIKFTGLSSNTLYYIELSYSAYRNNVGFTEDQKTSTIPFTDFTYTPIDAGITLGTITATQSSNKSVILTYNGSSNVTSNITKVHYTISLKGGSSTTSGLYESPDIFTITSDKTPKLTIDTSDSSHSDNTSFTFRSGNTYIITTQYYYMVNGKEEILTDQETKNTTYTTILNL